MSAALKTVYTALAAVMADVGAVGKNKKNLQGGGYQYRGIDDVMAALQPVMAEHGLVCVPRVVEREREAIITNKGAGMVSVRLLVEHTFYGPDGSHVVCTTLGEAFDSGDKASNKAMAVALKYALTETLMIPTYETNRDTEEETHEVAPPSRQTRPTHPTVEAAKRVFPDAQGGGDDPADVVRQAIEFASSHLRKVWPGEDGEDRECRLGWYWAQFATPKTAKMPADWSPFKALLQAGPVKCEAVKAAAVKLASGSRPEGADDDAA